MAALISSDFEIPAEISQGIFEKTQKGSTLAQLSGARPQKFGKQQVWVLTSPPKAELVGEAGQKSPTPTAYASKAVNPFKLQVTMRFSQEVQWADEDVQIGVLQDLASNASIALGRALDLVGIHKINPLTGTVSSLVKEGLVDTKQSVQLAGTKYDEAIEAAAGMIISSGYVPSGIAMDPTLSFGLSTMRDADGRKIYPEIGFGQNLTNFSGMTAAVSDTLLCDLAETYHIYDYKSLPCRMVATFSCGLRENSRIKMKMAGIDPIPEQILMAAIADGTRMTAWLQSEDGATGKNRPKSLLGMIIGDGTEKSKEIQTFDSGEDFDREWARLTGKEG